MVFDSANGPLCRKRSMILRGGIFEGEGDRAKKGGGIGGGFVVFYFKESERMR